MKQFIVIGSDLNTGYTPGNNARTITLTGMSWTPELEELLFIYNETQDVLYHNPTPGNANSTISGLVITTPADKPEVQTGDTIHIQISSKYFQITIF